VQEATRLLYISGQFGMPAFGQLPETFESQVHIAMDNVEALLRSAGMDRRNIVKLNYYYVRASDAPQLANIRRERWGSSEAPAVTAIVVSALARPEYLIEIEAIAAAQA
jgi:enamine deaminase RidA (YjgF/YER057c/UK114 family)